MAKNFYFRTETGGDEAIEVYLGQSSGKQLNEDILNSKSEVLIISPYIDESKLDELIILKQRNINVRIAFSSLRKDQEKKILQKLIHQNKETNFEQKKKKEKQLNQYQILSIVCICISVVLFLFSILNMKIDIKSILFFLISLISIYGFKYFNKKRESTRKIEIYKYNYVEKFNFKYLRDIKESKMFIHSKIYIIDRKIAYLGSLNFTNNGFTSNFETRIRITQKEKIAELVEFVHSIFEDNINFKSHEVWFLGQKVFSEEKY